MSTDIDKQTRPAAGRQADNLPHPPIRASKSTFAALREISRRQTPGERCELCGLALGGEHNHLLEQATGRICCACDPCAVLFEHRGEGQRYLRIPRDARRLENFDISDAQWNALLLPIDLAFFLESSRAARVAAYYPSPAGATESLLDLEAWREIASRNPALATMSPDVEALLVNRARGRRDYYIAPLDHCYKLTGLIRMHWHGLSGGDEVWQQIDKFFSELRDRSVCAKERAHA